MKKISIVLMLALLLTGCGASVSKSDSSISEDYVQSEVNKNSVDSFERNEESISGAESVESTETTEGSMDASGVLNTVVTNGDAGHKIIKTVNMSMQTKQFDEVLTAIGQKTKEVQGYTESSSIEGNSYYHENGNRSANIVLRIPQNRLESFLQAVEGLGNVTSQSMNTDNITLKYADTQSHKEALQIEYDRVLALLEKADTMESILSLESHLSELRYQLNQYESTLRTYDNQVDYSTVILDIYEVERITEVKKESFLDKIKAGFSDNLYEIGNAGTNFLIWLIVSLPYFIIWGMIIAVIILIVRKIRKRRRRKKETAIQEHQNKNKSAE